MFLKTKFLKPNMIVEKDVLIKKNNIEAVLLAEGQTLTNLNILKMKSFNIDGAYVKTGNIKIIKHEFSINEKLKTRALTNIRDAYDEVDVTGKISTTTVIKFSDVVNDLITEITVKKKLSNELMNFKSYDEYTFQHCLDVASLNISTGLSMGLSDNMLYDLGMTGLLHDIGKTKIPIEILNKPGKLTAYEYELMKTHPVNSVEIINNSVSEEIIEGIVCHHERVDGAGYPDKRSEDNICLYGKITALSDVFDALSTDRPYRNACYPNEVVEFIMANSGTQFDYEITKIFLKNVVAYPTGSLVKLSNGVTAIVVKNSKENILRPVLQAINPDNSMGEEIDLFNDYKYLNVTITETDYECSDIDYNSVSKKQLG